MKKLFLSAIMWLHLFAWASTPNPTDEATYRYDLQQSAKNAENKFLQNNACSTSQCYTPAPTSTPVQSVSPPPPPIGTLPPTYNSTNKSALPSVNIQPKNETNQEAKVNIYR